MRIISCSIDVTKIDKTKLVEGKNGAKYFNFDVIVNDEPNQYGKDVSISLSQTKEERTAKEKKVFIGSGKTVWKKEPQAGTNYAAPAQNNSSAPVEDDSLPF
jgi:hypothetical protein